MAKRFDLKKVLAPVGDVVRKLKNRRDVLMAEVEELNDQIARFEGRRGKRGPKPADAGQPAPKTRKRRSRDQLEAMAADIVAFIASKGKEGASGNEIKSQFGDLLPSVNAWLKNYSKAKVKTTGNKSKMKYFA
jgi:hypothetical protein